MDFYGETDSLGMFHIKIPVPAKSNNFAIASLTMQSFNIDNYPIPNLTTVNKGDELVRGLVHPHG